MTEALAESIAERLDRAPQAASEDRLLLTRTQVAGALQVSPKTVDRWVEAECLPHPVRIGTAVRWRREDLEQWVREQEATR